MYDTQLPPVWATFTTSTPTQRLQQDVCLVSIAGLLARRPAVERIHWLRPKLWTGLQITEHFFQFVQVVDPVHGLGCMCVEHSVMDILFPRVIENTDILMHYNNKHVLTMANGSMWCLVAMQKLWFHNIMGEDDIQAPPLCFISQYRCCLIVLNTKQGRKCDV